MNTRTLTLGRMSLMMVALAAIGVIALSAAVLVRPVYAADKGTICHANSGSKGFVVITIDEGATGFPHLDSNGSLANGHEQDILLPPDATVEDCQAAANPANLTITKTPDGGTVNAGNPISFTITVSNAGPGATANAVLNDTLPAGFEWVENPDKAECTIVSNVLHCDIASLASGGSFSVTVTSPTQAADCALVRNTAVADADNHAQISNAGDITVQCPTLILTPTPTPEIVVLAGTGTPAASTSDTAMGFGGSNPMPTIAFGLILLASLATLAYANVKTVRSRS